MFASGKMDAAPLSQRDASTGVAVAAATPGGTTAASRPASAVRSAGAPFVPPTPAALTYYFKVDMTKPDRGLEEVMRGVGMTRQISEWVVGYGAKEFGAHTLHLYLNAAGSRVGSSFKTLRYDILAVRVKVLLQSRRVVCQRSDIDSATALSQTISARQDRGTVHRCG